MKSVYESVNFKQSRSGLYSFIFLILGVFSLNPAFGKEENNFPVHLKPLGFYKHGGFTKKASEHIVYDTKSQRLFVTNCESLSLDVLTLKNPEKITLYKRIALEKFGIPRAIALYQDFIAIALSNEESIDKKGNLVILNPETLKIEHSLKLDESPYSVEFIQDGEFILTSNPGAPDDFLLYDPPGTLSIISLKALFKETDSQANALPSNTTNSEEQAQSPVQTIDFTDFQNEDIKGANFSFPGASFSEAIQPETLALYPDQSKVLISLQANNAIAVFDLIQKKVTQIIGLGYKNWTQQKIDISDQDNKINLKSWPLYSLYQPDGIAVYKAQDGQVYWVSANEGKTHDYKGYNEGERIHNLMLDYKSFPKSLNIQAPENMGRLKVHVALGDEDADGDYDALYTFGGRSVSIWSETGEIIWDSGSQIEIFLARHHGEKGFNASHNDNLFDQRSDDKGIEPEDLAIAKLKQRIYAFIGLERDSGIIVFDITNPKQAFLAGYGSTRNFQIPPEEGNQDLGVEDLLYIPAQLSPNKRPLLITSNEISSTTRIYEIHIRD